MSAMVPVDDTRRIALVDLLDRVLGGGVVNHRRDHAVAGRRGHGADLAAHPHRLGQRTGAGPESAGHTRWLIRANRRGSAELMVNTQNANHTATVDGVAAHIARWPGYPAGHEPPGGVKEARNPSAHPSEQSIAVHDTAETRLSSRRHSREPDHAPNLLPVSLHPQWRRTPTADPRTAWGLVRVRQR